MSTMTTGSARRRAPKQVSVLPSAAVPYQGLRAGVVSRVLANTVDFLVLLAALGIIYLVACAVFLLFNPTSFHFPTVSWGVVVAISGGLSICYLTVCWATAERTYGDHVLGLRVVSFRGHRMRWAGAALRAVLCVLFPIGVLWCAVNSRNRSVQDIIVRSSVVYDWGSGGGHRP
jgi:uncharacterized RDD family membrane protein YckC